jgi:rhamnose transport system permease protein
MALKVITAVVLGGTSIFGGRGRIIGMVLGVALIHETGEFVGWHWNHTEIIPLVLGGFLLATVAIHSLVNLKSSRS